MTRRTASPLLQLLLALCLCSAGPAASQSFPSKPIRLIVGDAPGGSADLVARVMATSMAPILGQPVVVENKPGAGYTIAFGHVAKQVPADGYTIAFVFVQSLAVLPLTVKDLRFDPLKDLPPFIGLAQTKFVISSSPRRPWKTVNEMIAHAKANPGKLTYASNSPIARLVTEAILKGFGIEALHVPFSSGTLAVQGIAQAQVDVGLSGLPIAMSLGENLRILATTGEKRLSAYPDVPTFSELGLRKLRSFSYSMNAPAATPKEATSKLYAAASQALKEPEVRARFEKVFLDIVEQSPEVAARDLAEEAGFYAEIAKGIGLRPE